MAGDESEELRTDAGDSGRLDSGEEAIVSGIADDLGTGLEADVSEHLFVMEVGVLIGGKVVIMALAAVVVIVVVLMVVMKAIVVAMRFMVVGVVTEVISHPRLPP